MIPITDLNLKDTIDSLNHPLASYLRNFLSREHRLTSDEIIIDDIENIEQAINAGLTLSKLFVSGQELKIPNTFLNQLSGRLPFYAIAPRTCKKIFEKDKITRVFAIAKMPNTSLLENHAIEGDIIVLDGLNITGNIGAIIRTSKAFNVGAIVLLNAEASDIYDRRIIRASRGYIFQIPVVTANIKQLIEYCKKHQFKITTLSAHAKTDIKEIMSLNDKMALVLGAEKTGCSEELQQHSDFQAKITMNPSVESLNVSVAASIVLYLRTSGKI